MVLDHDTNSYLISFSILITCLLDNVAIYCRVNHLWELKGVKMSHHDFTLDNSFNVPEFRFKSVSALLHRFKGLLDISNERTLN